MAVTFSVYLFIFYKGLEMTVITSYTYRVSSTAGMPAVVHVGTKGEGSCQLHTHTIAVRARHAPTHNTDPNSYNLSESHCWQM